MSGKRYTDEFKDEAIRQVTERGHPAREVVPAAYYIRLPDLNLQLGGC